MSIATEIQRLQNAKADIKAAIEDKGVEVGDGLIDTYAEKIAEISGGGGGLERYASCIEFKSSEWAGEELTLNLDRVTAINSLWSNFKDYNVKHLIVNCLKPITSMHRSFYLSASSYQNDPNAMEHITLNGDTSKCTTFSQAFGYCIKLKIIDGTPLDCSSSTNNGMFASVPNVEEIRFKENTIIVSTSLKVDKLSLTSLLSILYGLKDYGVDTETNLIDISKIPNIDGQLLNNGDSLEYIAPAVQGVHTGVTIGELCPDLVVGETVIVSYTSSSFMASISFGGVNLNNPSANEGTATTEVTVTEDMLSEDMSFLFGESPVTISNIMVTRKPVTQTYTLTLGSTNLAKLTDEQKAIATEKGWSLV